MIMLIINPLKPDTTKHNERHFMKLKFVNKGLDHIDISSVLRDKRTLNSIPEYFEDKEPPIISYSYPKSIASDIFNYRQTILNISAVSNICS